MVLFAGTCAIESYDICLEVATELKRITAYMGIDYYFKASFDKANRTSLSSFRGLDNGLQILERIKNEVGVKIITDVHESHQCQEVSTVADVLQIPAFLCRQTDLLKAAARTGKAINIKKGQFMKPEDMEFQVEKVTQEGNYEVYLTERGSSFGYSDLIVDFRSIPIMQKSATVIFDATHSTGGKSEYSIVLAKAAMAIGVDGLFIETHPNPKKALSDGPNMIPLNEMEAFLKMLIL